MICEYLWGQIPTEVKPRFVGDIPSQSEEGISLSLQDGAETTTFLGQKEALYRPYVQCFVRNEDYQKGDGFVDKVVKALDKFHDDMILSCLMVGYPTYLGLNEDKLHEFQIVFQLIVKE